MNVIHPNSLDLNLLRVFHAVFVERSVRLASEQLELTPSAVSHGLRKLREVFNDELFVRAGHSMAPTAHALQIFEPIRRIIESVATEVLTAIHFDASQATREFSLAMVDMAEVVFLPPLMQHLREHAPRCTLRTRQLANNALAHALDRGTVELALGNLPDARGGHFTQTLFEHDFVVLASADHPRLPQVLSWAVYQNERHLVVHSCSDAYLQERMLEPRGIQRKIALTIGGFLSMPWLMKDTELIATVPTRLAQCVIGIANLRQWAMPEPVPPYPLQSVWHPRSQSDPGHRWLRQSIFALMNRYP